MESGGWLISEASASALAKFRDFLYSYIFGNKAKIYFGGKRHICL